MPRRLIDFHTHCFPDAIAHRVIAHLEQQAGGLKPRTDGTLAATDALMREWGVSHYVIQNIATRPDQQQTINDHAASLQNGRVFCFGSVHPDASDAIQELERIKSLGLLGVKFHPDYQGFYIDETRLDPIYSAVEDLGLIAFFHTGYDPISPGHLHSWPAAVARVRRRFPRMTMVAAHLAGIADKPQEACAIYGQDIYLDTSVSPIRLPPGAYAALVRAHGPQRMLLGSDCPWGDIPGTLALLETLGLTPDELDQVCYRNAAGLLGLPA